MKFLAHIIDFSSWNAAIMQVLFAVMTFISTYVFGDALFAMAIFMLICIDVILGTMNAIKTKQFRFGKLFNKTIEKTIIYGLFMSAIWIITHIKTGSGYSPGVWADWIGYSWLAGKEFASIIRNITALRPGFFPKTIMDKIDNFEKVGKWQS